MALPFKVRLPTTPPVANSSPTSPWLTYPPAASSPGHEARAAVVLCVPSANPVPYQGVLGVRSPSGQPFLTRLIICSMPPNLAMISSMNPVVIFQRSRPRASPVVTVCSRL